MKAFHLTQKSIKGGNIMFENFKNADNSRDILQYVSKKFHWNQKIRGSTNNNKGVNKENEFINKNRLEYFFSELCF